MLIRSQDKLKIVNLQNLDKITVSESYSVYSFAGDNVTTLGTYSTKEKAIKVLDMICNFYTEHLEEIYNDQEPFVRAVFQMPQDEEV